MYTETPEAETVALQNEPLTLNSASGLESSSSEDVTLEASQWWSQNKHKISAFFRDPFSYFSSFWQQYKSIFVMLGWILLAVMGVRLTLGLFSALLDVAASVPLLSPFFELVGMGYTGWFVYRYLLKASNRQELSQKFDQVKTEIVGS